MCMCAELKKSVARQSEWEGGGTRQVERGTQSPRLSATSDFLFSTAGCHLMIELRTILTHSFKEVSKLPPGKGPRGHQGKQGDPPGD